MLTAINLDSSIGNTIEAVSGHLLWTMNETFAVLNGRTPLVDFHAQYGQLWAYLTAAPMALFGASIFVYTSVMAAASGLAMLAGYGIFRRVTRSSLAALALFVPFIATSFYMIVGPLENRYGPANLYLLWPIRFAAPLLTMWLTARHLDGAAPRRRWILFLAAGLTAVNNPDFGLASVAATLAALAAAAPPGSVRSAGRMLGDAVIGDAGAFGVASGLHAAVGVLAALRHRRLGATADAGDRHLSRSLPHVRGGDGRGSRAQLRRPGRAAADGAAGVERRVRGDRDPLLRRPRQRMVPVRLLLLVGVHARAPARRHDPRACGTRMATAAAA
jgi:hypothetical protein